MEKELEVKILNIDIEKMEKKLIEIGAKFIAKEYQENITINSSTHPISPKNGYLRIRVSENLLNNEKTIYLTYKEQINNEGIRNNIEHTTEISSKKEMLAILKFLGYDIYVIGYKKRLSYMYNNIRFDIDSWDDKTYPKSYMEIEVENEKDLSHALEMLDIKKEQVSTKSISELINDYEKGNI